MDFICDVAIYEMWTCKPHTPGAVSSLAHDQLQWQAAPVPFSQQADCCNLVEGYYLLGLDRIIMLSVCFGHVGDVNCVG